MRQVLNIGKLTLISSVRFKIFVALVFLLCCVVVFLPLLIQNDGTIKGGVQILLGYTLNFILFILSIATIWVICGSLAKEIESKTLYMVVTKPISKVKIILGKWLGVMTINLLLLFIASVFILGHIYFIAQDKSLKEEEKDILYNEVLVGREILQYRGENKIVEPKKSVSWEFSDLKTLSRKDKIYLRFRFFLTDIASLNSFVRTVHGRLIVRDPQGNILEEYIQEFSPGKFYEIGFSGSIASGEKLSVEYINQSSHSLTFPKDNLGLLVKRSSFLVNYLRVLLIGMFQLGLLSFAALFASVFMTFPVAIFFSMSFYFVSNSVSFLKTIAKQAIIFSSGCGHHHVHTAECIAAAHPSILDKIFKVVIKGIIFLFPDLDSFNFIDYLVLGRAVENYQVVQAFLILCGIYGLSFFLLGTFIFNYKEVALLEQ